MLTFEALKAELLLTMRAISNSTPITPENEIINSVCKALEVDYLDLTTRNRKEENAEARYIIFQLLKQHTKLTLKQIGGLFNRDYTTALHGIKRFEELHESRDKVFLIKLEKVVIELPGMDFYNPKNYG